MSKKEVLLYNRSINVSELRVIYEKDNLGVLKLNEALEIAQSKNLDLVLISTNPPIGKICDLGKFKYENEKKQKIQKKSGKPIVMKQLWLSTSISSNDLSTKVKHIENFLTKNFRVSLKIKLTKRNSQNESIVKQSVDFLNNFIENEIFKTETVKKYKIVALAKAQEGARSVTAMIAP
jgi:translation initiation factor IF-3